MSEFSLSIFDLRSYGHFFLNDCCWRLQRLMNWISDYQCMRRFLQHGLFVADLHKHITGNWAFNFQSIVISISQLDWTHIKKSVNEHIVLWWIVTNEYLVLKSILLWLPQISRLLYQGSARHSIIFRTVPLSLSSLWKDLTKVKVFSQEIWIPSLPSVNSISEFHFPSVTFFPEPK